MEALDYRVRIFSNLDSGFWIWRLVLVVSFGFALGGVGVGLHIYLLD